MVTLLAPASPAPSTLTAERAATRARTVSIAPAAAVLLLIAVAPFERPLVTIARPAMVLTTVEAALAVALGAASIAWIAGRWTPAMRSPLTVPGAALAGALLISVAFAPEHAGNALRFALRFIAAGLVALLAANAATTQAVARRFVEASVAVAACVGAIAVLEAAESPSVMQALTFFRPGFHVVGGQLRASSTLGYPTTASMYLEVAFAWGLWLLVEAAAARRNARTAALLIALATIGAGIVATFTRAGLIGMAVSLALMAALRWWRTRRLDRAHAVLALLAIAVVGCVILSRSPAQIVARWSTEGSHAWYGASYEAPRALEFVPGGRYRVPVDVANTGRIEWRSDESPPFALSYHWVVAGSGRVVEFNGRRTAFPEPVPPGGHASVRAFVIAPATPGWYDLVWDVVHEYRAWLSTEGVPPPRTRVYVNGPLARPYGGDVLSELPETAVRPDRITLWRAALRAASAHPVTGLGADNFRLTYGRFLGLETWDTRVHANNLYLEILTGAGVPALAALLWLIWAAARALWSRWRAATDPRTATALAAAIAACTVVAGHGLVDTFLSFTPTYVTFALAAGLAVSPALRPGGDEHADRV